jgi:hypothetical protein
MIPLDVFSIVRVYCRYMYPRLPYVSWVTLLPKSYTLICLRPRHNTIHPLDNLFFLHGIASLGFLILSLIFRCTSSRPYHPRVIDRPPRGTSRAPPQQHPSVPPWISSMSIPRVNLRSINQQHRVVLLHPQWKPCGGTRAQSRVAMVAARACVVVSISSGAPPNP